MTERFMPYTYKSLAVISLVALGLFALAGSGVVADSWLLPLLGVALATPAVILVYDSRRRGSPRRSDLT